MTHTLDQFVDTPVKICAEILLPVSQNLLAKGPREKIRKIYSKSEVFGQCRHWLQTNLPGVDLLAASSTARGAEMAAAEEGAAAIASELAAELYGLELLAADIQDLGGNTTRFLVIGKAFGRSTSTDKTSIVFGLRHVSGALYSALSALAAHNINMMKIESRPSKAKAWEYYFFVDVEGHAEDAAVKKALEGLSEHCTVMTVLGSYPKVQGREG